MTIAAGSVVSDLTSRLYVLLDKETSFARKFASDSSNTSAVPFSTMWKAMSRSVNQLSGLSASTAELNKSDGALGYTLGYAASTGRMNG